MIKLKYILIGCGLFSLCTLLQSQELESDQSNRERIEEEIEQKKMEVLIELEFRKNSGIIRK